MNTRDSFQECRERWISKLKEGKETVSGCKELNLLYRHMHEKTTMDMMNCPGQRGLSKDQ
jgi:hypothetical protein